MESGEPNSFESDSSEPTYVDPVIALLLPKPQMIPDEELPSNASDTEDAGCCTRFNNPCCSLISQWWNARCEWQEKVIRIVEQPTFHVTIIVLVFLDCLFIVSGLMLEFIVLKRPCEAKAHSHTSDNHDEVFFERIELVAEFLEYCSLVLLAVFIVEITLKVYAFGRHWWDCRHKLFEWFDAIIVITTFTIDLVNIHKKNFFTGVPLLFISLRLWRFVGIINSVAQTIRADDEMKMKRLSARYQLALTKMLNVSNSKTQLILKLRENMTSGNLDNIISKLESVDDSCRTILERCSGTSSSAAIANMNHSLELISEQLVAESPSYVNLPSEDGTDV